MIDLIVAAAALIALVAVLAIDRKMRRQPRKRKNRKARPRRLPRLEERVGEILAEFKTELFTAHEVWRVDRETRLDLHAAPLWKRMSELTRNAIVRHVWLALDAISGYAVVVVDSPRQMWNREIEARLGGGRSTLPAGLVAAATAPQYYKT